MFTQNLTFVCKITILSLKFFYTIFLKLNKNIMIYVFIFHSERAIITYFLPPTIDRGKSRYTILQLRAEKSLVKFLKKLFFNTVLFANRVNVYILPFPELNEN